MELPKHLYLSLDQLSLDQSESTTQLISCPLDNPHPFNGEEIKTRDWASLPGDLLVSVASRLTSLADFFSFRRVCSSWRSNVIPSAHTLSSQSPLIMMHAVNRSWCFEGGGEIPEEDLDQPSFDVVFLDVMHRRFYKSESSSSWRSFNLLNFSHGYLAVAYGDGRILLRHFFTNDKIWLPKTRKPFSNKNIIFSENPSSPRCMFVRYSYDDSTLEFFQQGESTWKEWNIFNRVIKVVDMVFFERKAYALLTKSLCFDDYQLAVFEFTPFRIKLLGVPTKFGERPMPYLFSYGDELLVSYHGTIFSWNFRGNGWIPRSSLDGRAKFFSDIQLNACIIPNPGSWVKPNCSYYYDMSNYRLSEFLANDDGSGDSVEFVEYIDEGMDYCSTWFIGRPVWIFPSVCFSN